MNRVPLSKLTPEIFSRSCPQDTGSLSIMHALGIFLKYYNVSNAFAVITMRLKEYTLTHELRKTFKSYTVKRFFNVHDRLTYEFECLNRVDIVHLLRELFGIFKHGVSLDTLLTMIVPEIELDVAESMVDLSSNFKVLPKTKCLSIASICTKLGVTGLKNHQIVHVSGMVDKLWRLLHGNKAPQKVWVDCPDGKTRFIKSYPETFQPYIKDLVEIYKKHSFK